MFALDEHAGYWRDQPRNPYALPTKQKGIGDPKLFRDSVQTALQWIFFGAIIREFEDQSMARRGRPAIPAAVHLARGSFRRSRHGRRADAPGAVPLDGTLNETQRNLLASIPPGLSEKARLIYERAVSLGYWLQASERDAIAA